MNRAPTAALPAPRSTPPAMPDVPARVSCVFVMKRRNGLSATWNAATRGSCSGQRRSGQAKREATDDFGDEDADVFLGREDGAPLVAEDDHDEHVDRRRDAGGDERGVKGDARQPGLLRAEQVADPDGRRRGHGVGELVGHCVRQLVSFESRSRAREEMVTMKSSASVNKSNEWRLADDALCRQRRRPQL